MPTFGQHETTERLFLSGVGAVYALKADEKKVVKVLQPPEGIWGEELVRAEIDGFLLRAKTQRLLAKQSPHWAPVHETCAIPATFSVPLGDVEATPPQDDDGWTGRYRAVGAYAVMDRYRRSVQTLIVGRVHVDNDDLRNIMSGLVRGLIDIRKQFRRPHGNLKTQNILLSKSDNLATATVQLTDPAPDGALNKQADREELKNVARILYELVNLRPYADGTIGKSKEWSRLGPNGEDWRELCVTLLDTGASAEALDLEKILATISTWTLKPKKSKAPLLIAASVLLVLALGGGAVWWFTRPPKLDFDDGKWQSLCLSWYSWFGDFVDKLDDDAVRKQLSAAPYPVDIVKIYNDNLKEMKEFPPKRIAAVPARAEELVLNPTMDAKTGYGPYYTKQAVAFIDAISISLTPEHWPLLKALDTTAGDFDKRGWKKAAAGIKAIIAEARPPQLPPAEPDVAARLKKTATVDAMKNINTTIEASRKVTVITSRWNHIQELLAQLPATDVPLLKALPKYAEELPRSEVDATTKASLTDVETLAESFTKVEALIGQLVADLSSRSTGREIDFAELAKDPAAQVPAGGPTLELYASLPTVARGYYKLTADPRSSVAWTKSLDEIQKEFIEKIEEANPQDANLPSLLSRHKALVAAVAAFGPEKIAAIEKNRPHLESLVLAAKGDLEKLSRDGGEWVAPYIIDPAKYLADQRAMLQSPPAEIAKLSPVVLEQWKKARAAFLAKIEKTPAELKKYRTFKAVEGKFKAISEAYAGIDGAIPRALPGLSEFTGNDWKGTIATRVSTAYRDAALQDLMTNAALTWADDVPQVQDEAYRSWQRQRLAAFEGLRKSARGMIDDYIALLDRLDHLYLQANEPAQGATPWRDLYGKWQAKAGETNPLLTDAEILGATKPIRDRAAALLALDGVNDYPPLLEAASTSQAPEIALTAWRKLGAAPVSQALPVLEDEDKAETALAGRLNDLGKAGQLTPAQLKAFSSEMAGQRPLRWRRWVETLSAPASIQAALDKQEAFGVTLDPRADAGLVYNKTLYGLRKEFDKNLKEAELKAVAQSFINTVNSYPESIRGNAEIQGLLARMAKPLQQSDVESSSAGAGPKLAGWEQVTPENNPNIRLYYFPNRAAPKHVLEFVRLQVNETAVPNGGQKTIFLCTTEMTVGLFVDVVNGSGKFADLDNTGKASKQAHYFKVHMKSADDIWADVGPRGWKISNRAFGLNATWLSETAAQMLDQSYYPEGAKPEPPGADDPMQLLSPWSAMYVARLLGCRLPTSDEWRTAYERFEQPTQENRLPKDAWNLRGEGRMSWATQQAYAKIKNANGLKYPDQGIFLTPDLLFAGITAQDAKAWTANDLAKIAPARITPGAGAYKGNELWFRPVGKEPGMPPANLGHGAFHDLVGNVGEYVFDGPTAVAVVKENAPTPGAVDGAIAGAKRALGVIGGSSLSPPDLPFNKKQELDPDFPQTAIGYCDVGVRLAYTAPIDSIADVLAATFKEPPYLPGAKAKNPG